MTESDGRILARRDGACVVLRIEGRGTAHHCPALRQFAEEALATGATALHVDLRDCTYLDSTSVGTLLHLQRQLTDHGDDEFALIAPSLRCQKILQQMHVAQLFPVVPADTPPEGTWTELETDLERLDKLLFQRNVVEAHQHLAAVPGPTGDLFRPLAESVAQELAEAQKPHRR